MNQAELQEALTDLLKTDEPTKVLLKCGFECWIKPYMMGSGFVSISLKRPLLWDSLGVSVIEPDYDIVGIL